MSAVAVLSILTVLTWDAGDAMADGYSPSPVTNMQAQPGNGQISFSWTAPTSAGETFSGPLRITKYELWLSKPGYGYHAGSCTVQITSCVITGLDNGVDYYVEIKAYNNWYESSYAGVFGPWRPCCSVPTSPQALTATAGNGSVHLTWTPPSNVQQVAPPVTYTVTSTPPGATCATTGTECDLAALTNGVAYAFSVVATTTAGASSPAVSSTVVPMGPPGAPLAVQGFLGDRGTVRVAWNSPTTDGGSLIVAYVATASPGGATCTAVTPDLLCTISGLNNGQDYTFTVVAQNAVGPGLASDPSPVARPLAGPGAPSRVMAKAKAGGATVSWSVPDSTGGAPIRSYLVTSNPGGRTCRTSGLTCAIKGLVSGTAYVFTVQAANQKGPGLPARSNVIRTPGLSPSQAKPTQTVG